jgi:hypothetical protein
MRTFWLSFSDPELPNGEQFLGVALIDVTDADAATAIVQLRAKFPAAAPGAEWIAAAIQCAWDMQCNPGGEILTIDVTGEHEADKVPRNRLLSKADLSDLGIGVVEP